MLKPLSKELEKVLNEFKERHKNTLEDQQIHPFHKSRFTVELKYLADIIEELDKILLRTKEMEYYVFQI